jgi:hypothetical protein
MTPSERMDCIKNNHKYIEKYMAIKCKPTLLSKIKDFLKGIR